MGNPRYYPIFRTVAVRNPNAGSDFSISPDGGGLWIVRSLAFTLVADANVGNRVIALTADDGSDIYFRTTATGITTAGQTRFYGAYAGSAGGVNGADYISLGLPTDGLILPQGNRLRSDIFDIQAGDQVSAITLQVEELPNGGGRYLRPSAFSREYEE